MRKTLMSTHLHTDDAVVDAKTTSTIDVLRRLYVARCAFAVVWAGLLAVSATALTPLSVALLVVYPLVDAAAAATDFRSSGATRARRPLYLTMTLSALTAVALAVAASSGIPSVLRVWGVWAITAGIVQLVLAVQRYRLGGQWALILSGGISAVAGTSFILMAAGSDASLSGLAGYAALGGVFFLISAIRLRRAAA